MADGTVSIVDVATQSVAATVTVGASPTGVACSRDNSDTYIVNQNTGNPHGSVSVINSSNTVTTPYTVGKSPYAIALSPDGSTAYVTNSGDDSISVIDLVHNTITTTSLASGTEPTGIAITPDGSQLFVGSNSPSGSPLAIATSSMTPTTITGAGHIQVGVALTPDGKKVYMANNLNASVSVIDTASPGTVVKNIAVGNGPVGIAISSDGQLVYVTNNADNSVSIIAVDTDTVIDTISSVGSGPAGIALTPDGAWAYVVDNGTSSPGLVSIINTYTRTVSSTTIGVGNRPFSLGPFTQTKGIPMTTTPFVAPQGRLVPSTSSSSAPPAVLTSDVSGAGYIWYVPYLGNVVPIYDGSAMQSFQLSTLLMTLNSTAHTSGNMYDLFVFLNSGTPTIGAGPAWTNSTSLSSRLQQVDGLWTNASAITPTNGSTTYGSVPAGEATYLGSVYITANGQTAMQFAPNATGGGTNNFLGVYNAYNRVLTRAICRDNTGSWNYSSATIRAANGSNSNRISFVDGLQQSFIEAIYANNTGVSPAGTTAAQTGVCLDNTNAFSSGYTTGGNSLANNASIVAHYATTPQYGFHFVQAVENNPSGTGTATFGNLTGAQNVGLYLALEM